MLLLSLLVFITLGSVPSIYMNSNKNSTEFDMFYNLESSALSWNKSDYINFTNPLIHVDLNMDYRIFIDDNDPLYNWSGTVANNTWCTGSGTYSDPYIIENLYINGGGSGGMIFIKNSDKFFIIRNCWFDYSGPNEFDIAVLLQLSGNGTIDSNIFTYVHTGTNMMALSYNNTVSNNIMIGDHTTAGISRAIELQCGNNTLFNNRIRNFYTAIGVFNSLNVTVDGNYAENTIWEEWDGYPIYLSRCNNSVVVRNTLAGAFASGSFQVSQIDSGDNIFSNNSIETGDIWTFGPETSGAFINTPKLSQGVSNVITLSKSHYNLVAHNRMLQGGSKGAISGFNIFILIGMFGVLSVFVIIIRRKRQ